MKRGKKQEAVVALDTERDTSAAEPAMEPATVSASAPPEPAGGPEPAYHHFTKH